MANYKLVVDDEEIPLYVVDGNNWGGDVQTIIYESPGTNGGIVITTGRTTNKITLTGKFVAKEGQTLSDLETLKDKIDNIKNKGKPVVLIAPVRNNDTGVYIISSFTGNVVGGLASALPFTMELTEYRQANLQRTAVNLISFEPAEEFKKILKERQISGAA